MTRVAEATVSLRWIRPFIRITGVDPLAIQILQREGVTARQLVDSDTRISHSAILEMLEAAVIRTHRPALGLDAAEVVEPGDLDVLEYAARSCPNLREAILCTNRYMELMHGGQRAVLIEEGKYARWEIHELDDLRRPPAANDFALAAALTFARRHTGVRAPLHAVHFRHAQLTDLARCIEMFGEVQFKLGTPCNALVFPREQLELRMLQANPGFRAAFEQHAEALLQKLKRHEGYAGRVRRLIIEGLSTDDVGMHSTARRLGVSIATLRRRLTEEGTSHSEVLDEVRRELAERYLADRSIAISEVAFLLGFSHATAFYKAFARWSTGETPREYRERVAGDAALATK